MKLQTYITKPSCILAIQYDGTEEMKKEINLFYGVLDTDNDLRFFRTDTGDDLSVAYTGDYLIHHKEGYFTLCRQEEFESKYKLLPEK